MNEEQNIELIRQFYEYLDEKEFSTGSAGDFFASSWIWHDPSLPTSRAFGAGGNPNFYIDLVQAFPDYVWTIDNIAATNDTVLVHYSFLGTFEEDWHPWGLANPFCVATQEEVAWEGVYVYRLEDGLIVEHWHYWDNPLVNNPEANCGEF